MKKGNDLHHSKFIYQLYLYRCPLSPSPLLFPLPPPPLAPVQLATRIKKAKGDTEEAVIKVHDTKNNSNWYTSREAEYQAQVVPLKIIHLPQDGGRAMVVIMQ